MLMDDLQSGLLRPDANSAGILPAVCLTTLRGLFFSELQKRICGLALLAVKGAAAQARGEQQAQQQQSATAARNLVLGLDLLGKVLPTVTTAGTLPVRPNPRVSHCASISEAASASVITFRGSTLNGLSVGTHLVNRNPCS